MEHAISSCRSLFKKYLGGILDTLMVHFKWTKMKFLFFLSMNRPLNFVFFALQLQCVLILPELSAFFFSKRCRHGCVPYELRSLQLHIGKTRLYFLRWGMSCCQTLPPVLHLFSCEMQASQICLLFCMSYRIQSTMSSSTTANMVQQWIMSFTRVTSLRRPLRPHPAAL